jgi:hypothetical protein
MASKRPTQKHSKRQEQVTARGQTQVFPPNRFTHVKYDPHNEI